MNFTEKDLAQIKAKNLTIEKVQDQIEMFKNGVPFVNLQAAATIDHGILRINGAEQDRFIKLYETKKDQLKTVKFVPASGAATRMFKFLFEFINDFNPENETFNAYVNRKEDDDIELFFVGLKQFPFYEEAISKVKQYYPNFNELSSDYRKFFFVKTILDEDKLNFGSYPKGLLPFHNYKSHNATAFEEHLFEAALYAASNGQANIHFTISEQHKDKFSAEFKRIEEIVEQKTGTAFSIDFSTQKSSTDTIAVQPNNEPFRTEKDLLVFRPSGHGALIENLNTIDADIIFIKNIDNVVVYQYEEEVAYFKKLLAGILIEIQSQAFRYLNDLHEKTIADDELVEIAQFLKQKMNIYISEEFEKYALPHKRSYLIEKLNRPIRVCGMVKNEGEPGGGPFWVKHENGSISLQIVESAQVDKKNKNQKEIFKQSTHFNPVDLVCGVRDFQGNKFDLSNFIDPKTAFISNKTNNGKPLKALELPGLWNGSMALWNTIFVEVPLVTFNPVKTINDLLKSAHQID